MKMTLRLRLLVSALLALLTSLAGCLPAVKQSPPLQTVSSVDLQRYLGTWHEIARLPQRFQKGCVASRAVYSMREDGQLGVYNECRQNSLDGPVKGVNGRARVVDRKTNAKLEVTFFWPFWGDYWIIDLDPDYQWAVVGHPSRRYLWILSRTSGLDPQILHGIEDRLKLQGYSLDELIYADAANKALSR